MLSQLRNMTEETAVASSSGSMDEKPGSSSAMAADSSVDVMAEAKKLIGAGNRHLVMGDVVSAVHVFQEACGMLAARYGDTADECGEAFFLCGKSLLELARVENSVLGNALEGVPEESSEEEGEGEKLDNSKIESADNLEDKTRDELRMQVYDAMAEKKTDGEDGKAEPKEEGKSESEAVAEGEKETMETEAKEEDAAKPPAKNGRDEKSTPPVDGVEETLFASEDEARKDKEAGQEEALKEIGVKASEDRNGEEAAEENMEEEDDDDDEGEGTGEDKEEEVGNLQLAWEMLEVAKVIYKRKENKEDQLMAAQAYLKLGEVGAESGNYPAAVEDFQDCLSLQLKHLPPHSRLVAETHYQLGMTYCITGQYSQAIQHYSSSVKVIESRLAMLQEVIDKAEGEDGAKEKTELEELKQLLPDVAEKVEDAKESQSMAGSASVAIQQTLAGASTLSAFPSSSSSAFAENGGPSSSCSSAFGTSQISVRSAADGASSSKSASDISHLVRKKRKTEESPVKDTDAKKTKQETTVNGSGDSGSGSNGVQEKGAQEPGKLSASVESSV
ncbi:histone-binding protein N1/N2 isoform X1 [Oncorhynchus mykiss]|uniref:Tetratricopeptide SHNi-TPR domain-containing protein n=1 Tax=Oncorhynchus mykiss TaxID=8022 RepID=A0A8C7TAA3_ONCMY|nr:histone-binding protein N1/N2 isoform X1 [Oncorhynchus mykiss]